MRVFDRQTDKWTDRWTPLSSLVHASIPCSAEKMKTVVYYRVGVKGRKVF